MKTTKGYYSLIQYCPDKSKYEAVNIGLVMFAPELNFLVSRITESNKRITKFFGRNSFVPDRINFLKESLQRRLENEKKYLLSFEEFDKFIKTRANELILTSLRTLKIIDANNPQKEFDDLYRQLIGICSARKSKKVLFPELDNHFKTHLSGRMQFHKRFQIPDINRTIDIPYSYRNGKLNLVEPHEFGPQGIDTGLRLAAEGNLIRKRGVLINQSQSEAELIILPKIDDTIPNSEYLRDNLKNLFSDFNIRSIWQEEQEEFIHQVEQEAKTF